MNNIVTTKVRAGHYRVGSFDVIKEYAGYGEDVVWNIERDGKYVTNAVSLTDAKAAIAAGVIA